MDLLRSDSSEGSQKAVVPRRVLDPGQWGNSFAWRLKVPEAKSYGGVLLSEGRVLLREPIDHLDGYVWTWPKGRPEQGETPAQTALREVYEETGYRARIVGVLPRAYVGTTRTNAFFLMEPVGAQQAIVNETAQIRWVSVEQAYRLIEHTRHAIGRNRDRAILDDVVHTVGRPRPASGWQHSATVRLGLAIATQRES